MTGPAGIANLHRGRRVRLKPRENGDILDRTLAGRMAVIEGIERDDQGGTHVVVVLEDDPGRDLAATRHPAHRFFFAPDEIEPLEESTGAAASERVLVAGIGNVFLDDDGFGAVVAQRLAGRALPPGVEVADFGIRGLDLAYALGQAYDAVILIDTIARGGCPGSIEVIQPDIDGDESAPFDSHRMDPSAVLRLARRLGRLPARILLVGCEPMEMGTGESAFMNLSAPVAAAVEPAVERVLELAGRLRAGRHDANDDPKGEKEIKGAWKWEKESSI